MRPTGGERLGGELGTLREFWRWAFGDLRANNVRGVFAEWMVAQLLGLQPEPRGSWDDYDIQLPDGRTIEVKASAYLQVWHTTSSPPSVIQFSGLKGQRWLGDAVRRYSGARTYNADIYVFCVQTERDPQRWDALALDQWDFYVLPRAVIAATGASCLRLTTVQRLGPKLAAGDLRAAIEAAGPDVLPKPLRRRREEVDRR